MLKIQTYLTEKQQIFKQHPFFQKLEKQNSFHDGASFTPRLTFWVMAFQDVLRLIPPRVQSKELRRIATHHKIEDSGHDKWFLQDMSFLFKDKKYDIAWLFNKENEHVRDFVYKVISEVLTLSKDHLRIILILVLESTGHIFFEKISNFAKLKGYDEHLKYFSSYHLEVELNHAVFEDELEKKLFSVELSLPDRSEAIELIARVYDGFNAIFDQWQLSFKEEPFEDVNTGAGGSLVA